MFGGNNKQSELRQQGETHKKENNQKCTERVRLGDAEQRKIRKPDSAVQVGLLASEGLHLKGKINLK